MSSFACWAGLRAAQTTVDELRAKLPAESLGDTAVNQHGGSHRGVSVIREVVRGAEDGQRTVADL